jgi:hypothetical protein
LTPGSLLLAALLAVAAHDLVLAGAELQQLGIRRLLRGERGTQ